MGHRSSSLDRIHEFLTNFTGVVVKNISELLDTKLNLTAANGSEMPYIGWVELNFRLSSCNPDLKVLFLVMVQCLDSSLISFNVIEEIIKGSDGDAALSQVIISSFTDLDIQTASVFANFIESLKKRSFAVLKLPSVTPLYRPYRAKGSPAEQILDQWVNLHQYYLNQMKPTDGLMVWSSPKHC